jgi:hypothetical protein
MRTQFLSFDVGTHRIEVPAVSLQKNAKNEHVAVLARSGLRVRLTSERKARLV